MSVAQNDRRSLFLMLSVFLFILLDPVVQDTFVGKVLLLVSLSATLVAAVLELHEKRTLRWLAICAAVPVVSVELAGLFHPSHSLLIVGYAVFSAFFGFVAVGLFAYLDKPGAITSGRIYASVSLYLILAMFWYAVFNLTEAIYPGSFALGVGTSPRVPRHTFLYFSLITLTTVGYGDVLPVSPTARIFAALEGVSGVLYIAITVARLVAAYQTAESERI